MTEIDLTVVAALMGRKGGLVSKRTPELFICTHPMTAYCAAPAPQPQS
jgi:hypothetical protein